MGMISVEMWGSFPRKGFNTCAEEGGHVQAIKRAIVFLAEQLGPAVQRDADLAKKGIVPPTAPLGKDAPPELWCCKRCNYQNIGPICTHCGEPRMRTTD